jgi:hypothetical protein
VQAAARTVSAIFRSALIRQPARGRRLASASSDQAHCPIELPQPSAPMPRPALPEGALWRSRCGQGRAVSSRPLIAHAARRCSSTSSIASALSVSPSTVTSAAPVASGSGSSGTSASACHRTRLAAATVATPPRSV